MNILAVTTFNAEGLEVYGRRMLRTFDENWPQEVHLRAYSEGWSEKIGRGHRFPLIEASPWLADFKKRHAHRKFKDFRWDAVRFSHKVAAVCHAARASYDFVIWIDGDVITHTPLPMDALKAYLPRPGEWISWLDRENMYPETGFFVLNCRHRRHEECLDAVESLYVQDRLFVELEQFHDCWVLRHVVETKEVKARSLSGSGRKTGHPMINGPLSRYFDHAKGPRKFHGGRSKASERVVIDDHPYWR